MALQNQLSLALLLFVATSVLGCVHICTQQFNLDMQAALTGDAAIATALSCIAITNHIKCLRDVEVECNLNVNYQQLHEATLSAAMHKYQQFCQAGATTDNMANCGGQFMVCNEQLNNTFNVAVARFDLQKACASLNNYSKCVENLISLPNCGHLSTQAMQTATLLQSQYGPSCQGDMAKEGQNIASCMNQTMQCFDSFQTTFSSAVDTMDMPKMCKSLDLYTTCVENLRSDHKCTQYIDHALVNIEILRSQHRVACGPDNGVKANECLNTFKVCYGHFNNTFNTHSQRSGGSNICSSLQDYSKCVATIPRDCNRYIGQPLNSLNMLKTQYSQFCDPDFQKMMSCSALTQCNRNLMGNFTISSNLQVTSMCTVLEDYFRCVDHAVGVCHLTQSGSTISFRDLGLVASRYCKTILTHAPLSNCMDLLSCHANFNMTTSSPTMLIDGTYWCSYIETALRCSKRVLVEDRCPTIDKSSLLQTFNHFQSMAESTCKPKAETTLPPLKITTPAQRHSKDDSSRHANVNSQKHNGSGALILICDAVVMVVAVSLSILFRQDSTS